MAGKEAPATGLVPQNLDLLTKALEGEGHEVVPLDDGSKASRLLSSPNDFDMMITDIVMPEKEGIEVISEIRKRNAELKILAMSGGGRIQAQNYLTIAKRLGANQTIEKPFKTIEFLQAVRELLA